MERPQLYFARMDTDTTVATEFEVTVHPVTPTTPSSVNDLRNAVEFRRPMERWMAVDDAIVHVSVTSPPASGGAGDTVRITVCYINHVVVAPPGDPVPGVSSNWRDGQPVRGHPRPAAGHIPVLRCRVDDGQTFPPITSVAFMLAFIEAMVQAFANGVREETEEIIRVAGEDRRHELLSNPEEDLQLAIVVLEDRSGHPPGQISPELLKGPEAPAVMWGPQKVAILHERHDGLGSLGPKPAAGAAM